MTDGREGSNMQDNDGTNGSNPSRQAEALAEALAGTSGKERVRLGHIMDLLPCYVAVMDRQRRIIFHNKAFERYFGNPGGLACYAATRGRKEPCRECPPFDGFASGSSSSMEWISPLTRQAFRVYSHTFEDVDGEPCVLTVGFDITSTVRLQQALELSEQSYRAITDNLTIGVALIDTKMRIKAGNIRLSQWFAQEFRLNRCICEILHCDKAVVDAQKQGENRYCPDCPFLASLEDGAGHEKELEITFEDGKEHTARLVTCPVKSTKSQRNKGDVRALIMLLEDITTRLLVNQQLQRARKLEAMSTLAGGIAHEINQPLSALHLYASGMQMLMEKQGALSPEVTQERLTLIMHEADKIRSIITHMRALVMQEGRVPVGAVSIRASIEAVLGIMKSQLGSRGIEVEADIPDDLPPVRSNLVQLEQVLVNLVANAMHAMDTEGGSRSTGKRRRILFHASVLPSLRDGGSRVRLEVADSGPGLPKGSERIFDPFYTTKERHEGMGLGLSIVYGLISLWGGEISASAHHPVLGGAVFYVDFHLAEPAELAPGLAREKDELEEDDAHERDSLIEREDVTMHGSLADDVVIEPEDLAVESGLSEGKNDRLD